MAQRRRIRPVSLVVIGTLPFALAACDQGGDSRPYDSVEACASATGDRAACTAAYDQVMRAHAAHAPLYAGREACELVFGQNGCLPFPGQPTAEQQRAALAASDSLLAGAGIAAGAAAAAWFLPRPTSFFFPPPPQAMAAAGGGGGNDSARRRSWWRSSDTSANTAPPERRSDASSQRRGFGETGWSRGRGG